FAATRATRGRRDSRPHGFRRLGASRSAARAPALPALAVFRLRAPRGGAGVRALARRGLGRRHRRRTAGETGPHHRYHAGMEHGRRGARAARPGRQARHQCDPQGRRRKDALLRLDYAKHLWMEKEIKSVANVARADIRDFLTLAAEIPIIPELQEFGLEDANSAL